MVQLVTPDASTLSQAVLEQVRRALDATDSRVMRAERAAALIRENRSYRWVGIYEVKPEEIAIVGWSGPGAPAHPRFPLSQGLCGAAARSGSAVVVAEVTNDPRYLTTFGTTRSEIVVPILDPEARAVLGLIDVESDRPNAFADEDRLFLERCSNVLALLWS